MRTIPIESGCEQGENIAWSLGSIERSREIGWIFGLNYL
jgi:hypothetical protein